MAQAKPVHRMINGRPQNVANPHDMADAAEKAWKRTAPQIDSAVTRMTKLQTALDTKVQEAVDDKSRLTPHGIAIASQVREHLKGLPEGERLNWLRNAVEAGDKFTVSAILSAPHYLSGITAEVLALTHAAALKKLAG